MPAPAYGFTDCQASCLNGRKPLLTADKTRTHESFKETSAYTEFLSVTELGHTSVGSVGQYMDQVCAKLVRSVGHTTKIPRRANLYAFPLLPFTWYWVRNIWFQDPLHAIHLSYMMKPVLGIIAVIHYTSFVRQNCTIR